MAELSLLPPSAARFQPVKHDGWFGANQFFTGDAFWTYAIETSTNLTDWSVLTNLTSTNGLFQFSAGNITNNPPAVLSRASARRLISSYGGFGDD